MKIRHGNPLAVALLTTGLLGLGALPALAGLDSSLDNYATDITLQNGGDHFTLSVTDPYPSNEQAGGYYVGLTTGVITDSSGNFSDPFQMFCNDFNDDLGVPLPFPPNPVFNINILSLLGSDPLSVPDHGLGLPLGALQLQALLGANFGTMPSYNSSADGAAQFDIWNLNVPPAALPEDGTLLANATAALPGANFNGAFMFDIVLPPGGDGEGYQAFMPVDTIPFHNSSSGTPEPGTLALVGLGLIGLGGLKLRRSQR
jgi:hypothetical protein